MINIINIILCNKLINNLQEFLKYKLIINVYVISTLIVIKKRLVKIFVNLTKIIKCIIKPKKTLIINTDWII